ncbi:hypothetical protein [Candidatus Halobonum tyrrellensis]|uniref:Uncharacterized protein n=1 Tax=Candidatus Halobonum tyrrellensis G22 TaxID=1324957 RepID=V4HPJ4_9EURY|nr:hypothetical protein [Candidatus Halobonum tyrrellensis]ESP89814.1 hypothetical protein K933_02486 [Candidatus Halobonum tyrrellensis G22]
MSAPPSDNTDDQANSETTTDWPPDGSDSRGGGLPWKIPLVGVVVVALVGWFVRPWLQGLVYALYTTPLFLVALVAGLVAGWMYYRYEQTDASTTYSVGDGEERELTPLRVAAVVFIVGLVALTPVVNTVAGATLSDRTMADTTAVERLDNADAEKPRIVTRAVAGRYASNTLNRPQYRVGETDISVANGTPYWAAPLSPDGLFNRLTKRQAGTVLVDMTTQQANVRVVDGELNKGIGTVFFESYRWHLLKNHEYLVDYGDPKMVVNDGAQYIVVPYSTPTFHLTPLPHSTPEWGGVAVIDSSGTVEMLSPEEAAQSPTLANQQLYPEDLARRKVASTKYRNGILNTYTSHEDEIEIAPVPGDDNDQPFFVLSESGPQYVVAVEPYGEAQGLREVWTIDGQTGAFEVYRPTESLFGPQKAADLVRQSAPQTDWNRFSPAEPILTVIDDREYWQVRIVPEDNSGIAYVAFVDARTSDVEEFEETEAIERFLAGETPTESPDQSGGGGEETPTVVVQRVGENGTVIETMEIYGNESVRIETNPNGSGSTTGTTANASTERVRAPL